MDDGLADDASSALETPDTTVEVAAEQPRDETATGAPRGEPVSSEPVLERVVVTPHTADDMAEAGDDTAEKATEAPARKGWWQRRFGS